ncbi:MAG: hypothetical protein ACRDHK_12525, partial [Actinomycetota bacterium]
VDLKDLVQFSDEPVRRTVFETDRLWSQAVCLDRNQTFGPVADSGADAVLTVIAGEAVVLVERKRRRLKQWGAALVPAGSEVTITNASLDPLVVLVITAPPPAREPGG